MLKEELLAKTWKWLLNDYHVFTSDLRLVHVGGVDPGPDGPSGGVSEILETFPEG